MWTDAHNHLQDERFDTQTISEMRAAGVALCVVNATCEADWPTVELLAISRPDLILPAFGIHPWKAHTATEDWLEKLRDLLVKHPLASIGECGLDQWVTAPSIDVQRPIFLSQLKLARELDRPVTIHALKAWAPLFECFATTPPPGRFLMHSFNGSIEIARRLIPLGAYFSFSGHFLHERKAAVIEVFKQLPRERILLETDAPEMLPPPFAITQPLPENGNHPANLASIGISLASALSMHPEELARLTRENAERCFGTLARLSAVV